MAILTQARDILQSWGVSEKKITVIMNHQTNLEQAEHLVAIEDCLNLLYREPSLKRRFLNSASKSLFFAGRKPIAIITSGQLSELREAHQNIRSMLCI